MQRWITPELRLKGQAADGETRKRHVPGVPAGGNRSGYLSEGGMSATGERIKPRAWRWWLVSCAFVHKGATKDPGVRASRVFTFVRKRQQRFKGQRSVRVG